MRVPTIVFAAASVVPVPNLDRERELAVEVAADHLVGLEGRHDAVLLATQSTSRSLGSSRARSTLPAASSCSAATTPQAFTVSDDRSARLPGWSHVDTLFITRFVTTSPTTR
jgi:hypothetical protein